MVLSRSARQAPRIAHRFAALHFAHGEHRGFERHDGLEADLVRGLAAERRNAVQRQPRPHPVAVRFRPAENAGRVADARREPVRSAATSLSASAASNAVNLFARHRTARFIGTREMRHDTELQHRHRQRAQPRQRGGKSSGRNPRRFIPVSIFTQMTNRSAPRCASSNLSCSGSWTTSSKPMMRGLGELFGTEHAFEQHDGRTNAGGAQRHAFFEPRHRETVGIGQRQRRRDEPVTVGIGFDDRHDLRARRVRADGAEVVAQRGGIHQRANQPDQRMIPSP